MRQRLLIPLVTFSALVAAAQTPVIRARLEPAKDIIVGQPVHLVVEVLVPNYFTGSPDYPTFELENAIVVLPEETPQNSNEQIGGVSYAGITQTYFLYPQQPGDFQLPPAQFTVPYASAPPKTTEAHLTLPALTCHADIPAAARDLSYFLPTTQLTMQQKWDSPLKNVRVGDTIERTITVTTAKMQGMLLPPISMDAPDGIRVYPEEPNVQNQKTDRGEFVMGRRTQSARYFIQKEGDYTLPAIELKWWNLTTKQLATATLPTVHFIAAPNPDYVAELPPEPEPAVIVQPKPVSPWTKYNFWIRVVAPMIAAVLLLAWLAWRYVPGFLLYVKTKRESHRHSEAAYFRNLIRACQRNDASGAYRWLLRWLARKSPGKTLEEFLNRDANAGLVQQINLLTAELYAGRQSNTWSGKELASCLHKQRKLVSSPHRQHKQLPALNL